MLDIQIKGVVETIKALEDFRNQIEENIKVLAVRLMNEGYDIAYNRFGSQRLHLGFLI